MQAGLRLLGPAPGFGRLPGRLLRRPPGLPRRCLGPGHRGAPFGEQGHRVPLPQQLLQPPPRGRQSLARPRRRSDRLLRLDDRPAPLPGRRPRRLSGSGQVCFGSRRPRPRIGRRLPPPRALRSAFATPAAFRPRGRVTMGCSHTGHGAPTSRVPRSPSVASRRCASCRAAAAFSRPAAAFSPYFDAAARSFSASRTTPAAAASAASASCASDWAFAARAPASLGGPLLGSGQGRQAGGLVDGCPPPGRLQGGSERGLGSGCRGFGRPGLPLPSLDCAGRLRGGPQDRCGLLRCRDLIPQRRQALHLRLGLGLLPAGLDPLPVGLGHPVGDRGDRLEPGRAMRRARRRRPRDHGDRSRPGRAAGRARPSGRRRHRAGPWRPLACRRVARTRTPL